MTLRAWIITMRGRIRERLCPDLQVLRYENELLRLDISKQKDWMASASRRTEIAEREAARLRRQVAGLKRHLARHESRGGNDE